jgi:Type II secretion system (T2SS), protein E, N-terminal domain
MTVSDEAQLSQTIEMFEVITQSQPHDYQSLEILKEAYSKLGRERDVIGTSKRIAEAYVHLGQLSSAILEYETILQRFPEDPDVRAALKEIEAKANNVASQPALAEPAAPIRMATGHTTRVVKKTSIRAAGVEDGRPEMQKIFVESKLIAAADFDLCWPVPDVSTSKGVVEPFIQVLADKGILPTEKSLKVLADKTRLGYLPLENYDIDLELARTFPADVCQRWCILPFDRMGKSLMVATVNPYNREAAKDLGEATKNRILWYLAPPSELIIDLRKAFR